MTDQPGYTPADIVDELQGILWDEIESPQSRGSIGEVQAHGGPYADNCPATLYLTDSYGGRFTVTISKVPPHRAA